MKVRQIGARRAGAVAMKRRRAPRQFGRRPPAPSRADVLRAFSTPATSRREALDRVTRYFGSANVAPIWSMASVTGTLGKEAARRWSRYLRRRPGGTARSETTGRVAHVCVQTAFDFQQRNAPAAPAPRVAPRPIADEWPLRLSQPTAVLPGAPGGTTLPTGPRDAR